MAAGVAAKSIEVSNAITVPPNYNRCSIETITVQKGRVIS
uniref:Polycomb group protein EMBRYONIC FLOWER 2-like n=1 Tax=Rhizophora mucronata TaxID=61149 RepID=A0A2P2JBD2_RHIMU